MRARAAPFRARCASLYKAIARTLHDPSSTPDRGGGGAKSHLLPQFARGCPETRKSSVFAACSVSTGFALWAQKTPPPPTPTIVDPRQVPRPGSPAGSFANGSAHVACPSRKKEIRLQTSASCLRVVPPPSAVKNEASLSQTTQRGLNKAPPQIELTSARKAAHRGETQTA